MKGEIEGQKKVLMQNEHLAFGLAKLEAFWLRAMGRFLGKGLSY